MADHAEGEHKLGTMDIRDHEKTYAGFIKASIWVTGFSLFILVFMALANS